MIAELTNHLWQSTLFAVVAGLLTVAFRRNRAQVRYWLWFCASIKFFLPFSLLMSLGSHVQWTPKTATPAAVTVAIEEITQPFSGTVSFVPSTPGFDWMPVALLAVWACGFGAIALMRLNSYRRIRAAVRSSAFIELPGLDARVDVRSSPGLLEPGVVGIFHPVLLLPANLMEHLTPSQLQAVLAHELCHVRRRDNLFAAIHMFVETILWFHPLVWWIGARMVEERERACDEEVLLLTGEPRSYAEGILNVCKLCVESPLACVSGISGSSLRRRIESIVANHVGQTMNLTHKILLVSAGLAALALPLLIGVGNAPVAQAQPPAVSPRQFDVASIKPNNSGANYLGIRVVPDGLKAVNATLRSLISEAYQVRGFEISGGSAWLDSARFDIDAKGQVEPGGSPIQTGLQVMTMLQALLADRFQLRVHRETKEMPIYALLVAKNGPKLQASREACFDPAAGIPPPPTLPGQSPSRPCGGFNNSSSQMLGARVEMSRFAANLARFTGRTVVDKTGLKETYDIALRWRPEEGQAFLAPTEPQPADDSRPSIFTAVQEQLGLRLESQRGPVEVLVVDSAERPSGN